MKDTSPEMEARFREMLMARSGAERLRMGFDMFDTARALVLAGLPPGTSEADRRVHLFLRFYGDEFTAEQRERIIAAIRRAAESAGAPPER